MSGPGTVPEIRLHPRGARRVRALHPWVFRDDVADDGGASHGNVVRVLAPTREPLGFGFLSRRSKIALRMIRREDAVPDRAFWAGRIREAVTLRSRLGLERSACRLVFAESDGVPGFVTDRYGEHLVVQALTAGTETVVEAIVDALEEVTGTRSVLARNDPAVRALEGLPREVRQLRGRTPESIEIEEEGVRFVVDPWKGQKTGAFLDQRENRVAVGRRARGRVLDVFSYHGSFGLHAAKGAEEVVLLDASGEALARARRNAEANGFANVATVEANAFEDLRARERAGERFEMVILDPPAFAKSRSDVVSARRGYKEVNLRAMRLVAPGGTLVSCSCSYNMHETEFESMLAEAAADAGAVFRVAERRGQSADHPVRLGFPESRYLKCFVLERAQGHP